MNNLVTLAKMLDADITCPRDIAIQITDSGLDLGFRVNDIVHAELVSVVYAQHTDHYTLTYKSFAPNAIDTLLSPEHGTLLESTAITKALKAHLERAASERPLVQYDQRRKDTYMTFYSQDFENQPYDEVARAVSVLLNVFEAKARR